MIVAFLLLILVAIIGYAVTFAAIPDTLFAYLKNIIPLSNPHGREDEAGCTVGRYSIGRGGFLGHHS
ncbi:high-affinity choline uptake protein BetT [Vibrio variabilis]|uniref:High-affinity choline uptake protein BetT n=1 Tax=Vibrio variabilis TaxID=990271 RepID=A0ABQ0JIL7_9VIBR|nr:high-affinity choline uptake protein BetT [Vibrio variabilis]